MRKPSLAILLGNKKNKPSPAENQHHLGQQQPPCTSTTNNHKHPTPLDSDTRKDSRWAFLRSRTRSKFTLVSRADDQDGANKPFIRKQTSVFSLGPLFKHGAKEPTSAPSHPRVGPSKHPPQQSWSSVSSNHQHLSSFTNTDGGQQCGLRKNVSSSNLLRRMSSWKVISQRISAAAAADDDKLSNKNNDFNNQDIQTSRDMYQISDIRFDPLDLWEKSLIQALDDVVIPSSSVASKAASARPSLPTPPPLELPPPLHSGNTIGLNDVEQFEAPTPILEKNERSTMILHDHQDTTAVKPIEFRKTADSHYRQQQQQQQQQPSSLLSAQLKNDGERKMVTKAKLEEAATRRQLLKFQQMREQADEAWLETLQLTAGGMNVNWAHSETLFSNNNNHHRRQRPEREPMDWAPLGHQEDDTLNRSDVLVW